MEITTNENCWWKGKELMHYMPSDACQGLHVCREREAERRYNAFRRTNWLRNIENMTRLWIDAQYNEDDMQAFYDDLHRND